MHDKRKNICIFFSLVSLAVGVFSNRLLGKSGMNEFYSVYVLSFLLELFFIGIPAVFLLYAGHERWLSFRKMLTVPDSLSLGLALLAAVSLTMVSGIIGIIWRILLASSGYPISDAALPDPGTFIQWVVALFTAAFIPAICEEMLFRGFALNVLKKKFSENSAVFLSALLFALSHLNLEGFPSLLLIGFVLAKVLCKRGSLWLPILIHAGYNAASILINASGADVTVTMIMLCAVIFFISMRYLLRKEESSCN